MYWINDNLGTCNQDEVPAESRNSVTDFHRATLMKFYSVLGFKDGYGNDKDVWDAMAESIKKDITTGMQVVIYCGAGISRSNAMALTVLIKMGYEPTEAIKLIEDKVPIAQMEQNLIGLAVSCK